MLTLGWFSSGGGEGSFGMLRHTVEAIEAGELDASIEFLFCSRDRGQRKATDEFLRYADEKGIPVVTLSSYKFRRGYRDRPWTDLRQAYDEAAITKLAAFSPAVSVAAGYMLIAPLLCEHFLMVNQHPALPGGPIGTWQDVVWELIAASARESGVMVHRATNDLDSGPVLACSRFPIAGGDLDPMWEAVRGAAVDYLQARQGEELALFKAIRGLILARERPMLTETLKAIAAGKIDPAQTPAEGPLDLTELVEAFVRRTA